MSGAQTNLKIEHDGRTYGVTLVGDDVWTIRTIWDNPDPLGPPSLSRTIYQGFIASQRDNPSPRVKAILAKVQAKRNGGKPVKAVKPVERYLCSGRSAEGDFDKPFKTKGLAFAFARREAPSMLNQQARVERQTQAAAGAWAAEEAWVFHADGRQERITQ